MKQTPEKTSPFAISNLFKKPASLALDQHGSTPVNGGRVVFNGLHCTGCALCMRDCPTSCLKIGIVNKQAEKKYICRIGFGQCIFCCQCVDSCEPGCLSFAPDIERASLSKAELIITME